MTAPLANEVDEAAIRQLLDAFEVTMADVNAADASVNAVSGSTPWHGEAANQYRRALSDWLQGLAKVRNGLEQLRTAMTEHLHVSTNAEDESASQAKWYQPA
ncbi:hypothetical protein ABZS66_11515 [Dactylosporangium sp. NPDC005572]|uniref:hypothetical protein n=1 Tax=Dactylosporangium sp. NPDC005572 TaxID=3156889 RepID=UPI0033B59BA8